MGKYKFEDFKTDSYIGSTIGCGQYGFKTEISVFNPIVPAHYREKALDVLNDFIEKHNEISCEGIDSVSGSLEAYIGGECINKEVEADKKYALILYIYNNEGDHQKDYIIDVPILSTEEHFPEFRQCIMKELENMIFG